MSESGSVGAVEVILGADRKNNQPRVQLLGFQKTDLAPEGSTRSALTAGPDRRCFGCGWGGVSDVDSRTRMIIIRRRMWRWKVEGADGPVLHGDWTLVALSSAPI